MQKPWGGSTLADLGNSEKVLQQDQCGGGKSTVEGGVGNSGPWRPW